MRNSLWHIKINPFKREHIPAWIIVIGVLNAFVINILHLKLYILTVFIIVDLTYLVLRQVRQAQLKIDPILMTIVGGLAVFFGIAAIHEFEDTKSFIMIFTVIIYISWAYYAVPYLKGIATSFYIIVWVYLIGTWIIYLFFWNQVSDIFNETPQKLGMMTAGIHRSYGLVYNALTNGYLLLILFYIFLCYSPKSKLLLTVLLITIGTTLVRGAFVSLVFFIVLYSILKIRIKTLIFMVICLVIAYFSVKDVAVIIDSIVTAKDSQGSAQLHMNDIIYSLENIATHMLGFGFSREAFVESWIFAIFLITGWIGGAFFVGLFVYLFFKIDSKGDMKRTVAFISFIPPAIVIPFYSFNLSFLLFWMLIFLFFHEGKKNKVTFLKKIGIA